MKNRFVVLSGCSGGGKSTLLEELRRCGHGIIEEPGRRIVQMELENGGAALPWNNLEAFARKAIQLATDDLKQAASMPGLVFFDRGLIDAAVALQFIANEPLAQSRRNRYYGTVFLVPPWQEIYVADGERRHSFAEAEDEFERLYIAYRELQYKVILLPKESTQARAQFVLAELATAFKP